MHCGVPEHGRDHGADHRCVRQERANYSIVCTYGLLATVLPLLTGKTRWPLGRPISATSPTPEHRPKSAPQICQLAGYLIFPKIAARDCFTLYLWRQPFIAAFLCNTKPLTINSPNWHIYRSQSGLKNGLDSGGSRPFQPHMTGYFELHSRDITYCDGLGIVLAQG